jgi:hypothetical protein
MRLLRLAAFACVATVLSLASHLLAGGAPPTWWATLVACAIPAAAGAALVRRRRGLLGIGIVLGAVQVILHEIFTASAMPAAGTGMGNSMNAGSGVLDDAAAMHPGGDAWMLLAHAAAVPVTAGILNHGDTVIVLLLAWLRPVPAILAPPLPLPRPALSAVPAHPILACPLALRACASVVRRGPPAPAC